MGDLRPSSKFSDSSRWHALIEQATDILIAVNHDGEILYINRVLDGFEIEKVLGRKLWEFIPPQHQERMKAKLKYVLASRQTVSFEIQGYAAKQTVAWYENRLAPTLEKGKVTGAILVARDISRRREAEENLQTITDSLPVLISYVDRKRRYRFVNQTHEDWFGLPREQIIGKKIEDVMGIGAYRVVRNRIGAALQGRSGEFETTLPYPSGGIRHVRVSYRPRKRRDGRVLGFYLLVTDITVSKLTEIKLKDSEKRLHLLSERAFALREEDRRRIAREVHDELGQLMTALKLEVRGLQRESFENSNDTGKRFKSIYDLVDLSIQSIRRIAADLRPSILDDFGLTPAIEHELERFRARSRLACTFDCELVEERLDPELSVNLFRILQETLTNVLRHAKATKVRVRIFRENGSVILSVSDDGIGISENDILSASSLGLMGMRERVRGFKGELSVGRSESGGTVVKAKIPTQDFKREQKISG